MKKPTIVVIGRADVIKLGLIRLVGRLDYKVIVIHLVTTYKIKHKPLDYYSKYVSSYLFSKKEDLVNILMVQCVEKDHKPVLFTLDDLSIYLIDQSHHILKDFFLYANVHNQENGIIRLMNKNIQKTIAVEAGLTVAKGWTIPFIDGKYIIPDGIEFPCFVKGELGYEGGKKKQKVCHDYKELCALLQESKENPSSLLAEEYLPVDEELGFMGISDGNHSTVPIMVEKTEIGKGTCNGVTMAGNIVFIKDNNPIIASINKFLVNLGYTGISNLDFIKSKGKLYFLEANFRYAAYGYRAGLAGVNLPQLFIELILGNEINIYEIERKGRWSFFNEKVGIINVIEKLLKYTKYRELKKQSDCCLVYSYDDPLPYRWFLVKYYVKFIKSRIKSYCQKF